MTNLKLVKSKKVVLPGLNWKNLKAINLVLSPTYILVPLIFIFLIAQVVDDLKAILNSRELRKLSSIRFYSKVLYVGFNSVFLFNFMLFFSFKFYLTKFF